jgi:hypothetical protein
MEAGFRVLPYSDKLQVSQKLYINNINILLISNIIMIKQLFEKKPKKMLGPDMGLILNGGAGIGCWVSFVWTTVQS